MPENITVHGSPQRSVFGLIGSTVSTDEGKAYVKTEHNSKNVGWKQIVIPPTPSVTVTPTPTKTVFPARSPRISPTPTQTPTITGTPRSTSLPPTINYTIASSVGGSAARIDGPTPTGTITVGSGQMTVRAVRSDGYYFDGWSIPASVNIDSTYAQDALLTGFNSTAPVTITANFLAGTLEEKKVNARASIDGKLRFYYRNLNGFEQLYNREGLSGGQSFTPLDNVCAAQITSQVLGTATLSTTPCNLPPTPEPSPTSIPAITPVPTSTPTQTPSSAEQFSLRIIEGSSYSNCSDINSAIIGITVIGTVIVQASLSYTRPELDTRPIYLIGQSAWVTGGGTTLTSGNGTLVSDITLVGNNTFTFGAFAADTQGFNLTLNVTQTGGTGTIIAASYRGRTKATEPTVGLSAKIQTITGQYKYNIRNMTAGVNSINPGPISGNSGDIVPSYSTAQNTITLIEFLNMAGSFSSAVLNPDLTCESFTPTPTPTETDAGGVSTPTPTPTPTSTEACILYVYTGLIGEDVTVPCCNGTNPTNFVLPGDIYCCRSAPLTGTWAPVNPITLCAGCFQS